MPTCSEKSNQQLKMLEKNPRSLIVGPRNQEIQKGKSTKMFEVDDPMTNNDLFDLFKKKKIPIDMW